MSLDLWLIATIALYAFDRPVAGTVCLIFTIIIFFMNYES